MNEGSLKDVVETIAKVLVDSPDEVAVNEIDGAAATVLELRVAPQDLGKVIGKQGRTARAMRTLLRAAGMKVKKRFVLEIVE
ncbi:MAG TPA: KH domain-containing protein [Blastocatellia bacterium]|nr:KH domain-containing protein [Blastocatellia bacterium]